MKISNDYRKDDLECWPRPSELELARLAAELARTDKINPQQLVAEAWALYWESCRTLKEDDRMVEEYYRRIEGEDDHQYDYPDEAESLVVPTPKKYPVSYKEVEMLLLPKLKGRTGQRASVVREYAFAQIIAGSFTFRGGFRVLSYWDFQPEALVELREKFGGMVAERFGLWRKSVFDANAYTKFAGPFLRWYSRWTERNNSEVRAANALKGWEKRRQRNKAKTGARPNRAAKKEFLDQLKKPS
jgi:hypothetical protein